jgi:hypothetical protein
MGVILGQCPEKARGFGILLNLIYMGTPAAPPSEPTVTKAAMTRSCPILHQIRAKAAS